MFNPFLLYQIQQEKMESMRKDAEIARLINRKSPRRHGIRDRVILDFAEVLVSVGLYLRNRFEPKPTNPNCVG
ncbi:MAG: hypothetical protein GTO18_21445 [Anaerolineales bacterium]|nr:hypothetical protein [Anaerolineales bacterium]